MSRLSTMAIALCGMACGGHTAVPDPRPVDPAIEARAVDGTAIRDTMQIVFDWRLVDRDGRFSGQGVLRIEPGRARLDLFGPRSESYLSAVLDGLELRLPPDADETHVPPPPLFWSVLGVLRPPPASPLAGTRSRDGRVELWYGSPGNAWQFRLEDGRLTRAEWTGSGSGRRTVELSGRTATGTPEKAVYRDWPAFLQLELVATEVVEVDGFPEDVWTLRSH